jgi:hypothetical protein
MHGAKQATCNHEQQTIIHGLVPFIIEYLLASYTFDMELFVDGLTAVFFIGSRVLRSAFLDCQKVI